MSETRKTCGAKRSSGKGDCRSTAIMSNGRCRIHGGASPAPGPTHPGWKHGRHSKYLPARLQEKYAEAMADANLTEYRDDIAMLQARLFELLETGESLPLWGKAQEAFKGYKSAERDRDVPQMAYALAQLQGIINRGLVDALRWADIYRVTEQIGKTKEREHKRLVQMSQMVTNEQLIALLGQIADVAKRTITNQTDLQAFAQALNSYGLADAGAGIGGH